MRYRSTHDEIVNKTTSPRRTLNQCSSGIASSPLAVMLILMLFFCSNYRLAAGGESGCRLTPYDEIGPFYLPDAPERATVGKGYVLEGVVRSYPSCISLAGAKIEFWLVGPSGRYDDQHRGIIYADAKGAYRLETDFPPPYSGRPPHIHFLITAEGHERLITQQYPEPGSAWATFDIVMEPER